ncbi:MAG: HdeD family acid-resistance protein [Bdellovibrionia bacterium]
MLNRYIDLKPGWSIAVGIFLIIVGILSISLPVVTTLSISWLLGIAFIVSGIAQIVHLATSTKDQGRFSRLLLAAFSIVAGVVIFRNLLVGAMAITLTVAFYFLASAVGRGLLLRELGSFRGRGWLIASSALSFLLGLYLIVGLPVNSLIIPGLFFGVDLVFYGSSLIALALTQRKVDQKFSDFDIDRVA